MAPSAASDEQNVTAPPGPKLRDSCDACASSKLKCSKEKPQCSRCAKRGLDCIYVATRRGGRKPNSRSSVGEVRTSSDNSKKTKTRATTINTGSANVNSDDQTQLPSPSNSFAVHAATTSTEHCVPSPGTLGPSPGSITCGPMDSFSNLFSSTDQGLFTSCASDLTAGGNEGATTPFSFSSVDMTDAGHCSQTDLFPTDTIQNTSLIDFSALFNTYSAFSDTVSGPLDLSTPSSLPNNHATPAGVHTHLQQEPIDAEHSCLVQALGFMRQLSSQPSSAGVVATVQAFDKEVTPHPATAQGVVSENAALINAVTEMLRCSCSQDGYLLTLIALIIFKVLGRYAAASQKTGSHGDAKLLQTQSSTYHTQSSALTRMDHDSITSVSNDTLDDDQSARMAAQLVLNELNRQRVFVNQLSSKLRVQAIKTSSQDCPANISGYRECDDSDITMPLSGLILDQLEIDLRRQFREISSQVLERLRTF